MCLLTNQIYPKIAGKNITCYKILRQLDDITFESMYYNPPFRYIANVLYKTDIEESRSPCAFDEVSEKVYRQGEIGEFIAKTCIGAGFHSMNKPDRYHSYTKVKCIIPKGSE